ncbi:MAG: NAD(P)-dependent oxidoreductase [Intestinibacillus sp.]
MKVVFLEPLGIPQQTLREGAEKAIGGRMEVVCHDTRAEDVPTLIERSKDADAVVLSNFAYRREVMEHCPNLKLVCVAFTGVDHVDVAYCRERGITVCNCAGYSTAAVADLVFGFAVALARNILPCDHAARSGGTKDGLVGFELEGRTFGIVGAGAIGQRVARIAQAFGCGVLAYSRTSKELPGVTFADLPTVLRESDFVSLHVPLNDATRGMIGAAQLAQMKPTAYLINTARGPIVDSAALSAALENGVIAGAAADVFETEPPLPTGHPLLHAPHLIATPHIAFASQQAFEKRAVIVNANLRAWLDGAPQNVI